MADGGTPLDVAAGAPVTADDISEGDRVIYRGADGPEVVTVVSVAYPGLEAGEEPMVCELQHKCHVSSNISIENAEMMRNLPP